MLSETKGTGTANRKLYKFEEHLFYHNISYGFSSKIMDGFL